MPAFRARRRFALAPGEPERIDITWKQGLKDVRVRFDGEIVGRFADEKAFQRGAVFPLPTGGTLAVRWLAGLRVRHDGRRVAEGIAHYRARVHTAWFWIVANGVIAGWLALAIFYSTFSIIVSSLLGMEAAAMLVAAWFVREGSRKGILIAIAVSVVDGFLFLDESNAGRAFMALVWKGVFIASMIYAYKAAKLVEAYDRRAQPLSPADDSGRRSK